MNSYSLRRATLEDLAEIQQLFVETIETICSKDYSKEQIMVWTSSIENQEKWQKMIVNQYFILAIETDKIVGFGSLENDDYLDVLYVHKDFQQKGIANFLYEILEKEAISKNATQLISDVSITAKPFFESKGFEVIQQQEVIRQNVSLINFKMIKQFSDANTTNH